MKDDAAAGVEVTEIGVDRLCEALAAIAFDWWRRQAQSEADNDSNPSTAQVESAQAMLGKSGVGPLNNALSYSAV